jgi:hypothetical protein
VREGVALQNRMGKPLLGACFADKKGRLPSGCSAACLTSRSKLCTKVTFLFFRTQPAAGSYPQFCLLQPVHAAASLRMLAASAGVSPTEHRRAAPTRAAAVGAAHGGALHSPPRRQRMPGTSAAAGGTLCGQACRQPLPLHVCARPSSCCACAVSLLLLCL